MPRLPALPLLLTALAACASGSASTATSSVRESRTEVDAPTSRYEIDVRRDDQAHVDDIAAEPARVFALLPGIYKSLGVPLTDYDTTARRLGTGGTRVRGRLGDTAIGKYLDCGTGPMGISNADRYAVTVRAMTTVAAGPVPSAAQVTTKVDGWATPVGEAGNSVQCTSMGELEHRIATALHAATLGVAGAR